MQVPPDTSYDDERVLRLEEGTAQLVSRFWGTAYAQI